MILRCGRLYSFITENKDVFEELLQKSTNFSKIKIKVTKPDFGMQETANKTNKYQDSNDLIIQEVEDFSYF